jgi:tetratricopeptide (TPR) repeat protein/membrane protease YdiL (CAAX protease family)
VTEPAFSQDPSSQLTAGPRELGASVYFVTLVGLLVAFPTIIPSTKALYSIATAAGLSAGSAWPVLSVATCGVQILLIFGIVLFVERRPLMSLGLGRPTMSDAALGIAMFTAAVIFSGIYAFTMTKIFPHSMANLAPEQFKRVLTVSIPAALALAVGAGFAEEIAERGFAFDRIRSATGSVGIAIATVLVLSSAAHIAFWGWRYAFMVVPTELILTLVYLWRGNLWPNIIAHSLYDSFPVLLRMAMIAAMSLFGLGSYHALVAQFRYGYQDYPGAVEEYTRALASAPKDSRLLSERAGAELMTHDYAQAIADLDAALAGKAGDPDYLMQRAMVYYYAGFYQQAKSDADKSIAASPSARWSLYEQRSEIEKWLNQPDKSIADLDLAIKLSKTKNAELFRERGQAYLAKQDYDSALRDLKQAAELSPDDTETLSSLAFAYFGKKQYAQEAATLTHLLEVDPANVDAHISRADARQRLGQYQAALDDYRAAVKYGPDNAQAVNDLSWQLSTSTHAEVRDGKRALELANHACELSGWAQATFIDTLAAAYAEQGNFNEAVIWQQRAIDLAGQSDASLKRELENHLARYLDRQPYREELPSG